MKQSEAPECEALALLSSPEDLKSLRSQSPKFLKKLADHPLLLKDMLDIGLRPTHFQSTHSVTLTSDLPALAIDTLVNLYEDFIDLLAFDRILPKDRSLQGLEMEEQEQGQMKDEQEIQGKQEFKLLTHIHQCIIENQPEDTAYSYMNRLIGPLCYQRSVELMRFYQTHPEVMRAIVERMDHRGIVELFCKILETECGKQFYREYKCKHLQLYFQQVSKAISKGEEGWLQGLQQIYRFMTEKMQERCDQNKYLSLLQSIEGMQLSVLIQLNTHLNTLSEQGVLLTLRWIEQLLKHDNYVMGQTNIRLSITFMNRKNSISNNFYNDEFTEAKRNYHITEAQLNHVLGICKQVEGKWLLSQARGNIGQILISFYRVLYFFTRIWHYKAKEKQMGNAQQLAQIINLQFLDHTLMAVGRHPGNTSLHNSIKELVIECIREGIIPAGYFYQPEGMYYQMMMASFPRNRQNTHSPFSQQLYHIYKEVIVTYPHVSTAIEKLILEQTTRMGRLIGGDPRKLHADSLRGSSNAFSESSQNLDDILEFDLSQHSLSLSNNSLQSKPHGIGVIKVHNSPSIERSELEEVGEERIVIEGAQEDDD